MKGTFFSKPLEWNIETNGESWLQGQWLEGVLKVRNHGTGPVDLTGSGVGLSLAEMKKVHTRKDGALKIERSTFFSDSEIMAGAEIELKFSFLIDANSAVSDKKSTYYLTYGNKLTEAQLQLKIEPMAIFSKIAGLLDTFYRFKLKELRAAKKGVEFKFIPPSSKEMATIESLSLIFFMNKENLHMTFDFLVKKLDTSSVITKLKKESVVIEKSLSASEYALGRELINQDQLLKTIGDALKEIKVGHASS